MKPKRFDGRTDRLICIIRYSVTAQSRGSRGPSRRRRAAASPTTSPTWCSTPGPRPGPTAGPTTTGRSRRGPRPETFPVGLSRARELLVAWRWYDPRPETGDLPRHQARRTSEVEVTLLASGPLGRGGPGDRGDCGDRGDTGWSLSRRPSRWWRGLDGRGVDGRGVDWSQRTPQRW